MNENTNTATPVASNYETKISAVTAAILKKKGALLGIYGGLWQVMVENFKGLTALEYKVIRSEVNNRLKASDFADASIQTQLSVIGKLLAGGKELPETWSKAKVEYSAVIEAERAANPDKSKTGRKPRPAMLKSESEGKPAVNPETGEVIDTTTGAPTGATLDDLPGVSTTTLADPVGDMLNSFRSKIAALLVAGIALEDVESNIANVLAALADMAQSTGESPILDESEDDGEPEVGDFVPELERDAA